MGEHIIFRRMTFDWVWEDSFFVPVEMVIRVSLVFVDVVVVVVAAAAVASCLLGPD